MFYYFKSADAGKQRLIIFNFWKFFASQQQHSYALVRNILDVSKLAPFFTHTKMLVAFKQV